MGETQTTGTTLLPGFLIGGGSALLASGLGFLWLAIDPSRPEDPYGILDRGLWLGPIVIAVGLFLLAAGWWWLRRAKRGHAGRQAATDALLAVFMLYAVMLVTRGRWPEAVGLTLSVGIVFAVTLLGVGRGSGQNAEPGAAADPAS